MYESIASNVYVVSCMSLKGKKCSIPDIQYINDKFCTVVIVSFIMLCSLLLTMFTDLLTSLMLLTFLS